MINNVVLTGRLTKDIELRYTSNNIATTSFNLAVNRAYASNGGQDTDFVNCVAFRKTAEVMAKHLTKGSLIGVQGRVQTRNYQGKDGKTVYVTEIVVDSLTFLESKSSKNSGNSANFNDIFGSGNDNNFRNSVGNDSIFDNIQNPFLN